MTENLNYDVMGNIWQLMCWIETKLISLFSVDQIITHILSTAFNTYYPKPGFVYQFVLRVV
ncbi:hypothetical protein SAMN04488023_1424 [Pedobacter rhizosphaerae]|uniref:Uncharacterized protein n=1 Tax=Pedobacter rhizosphaerae TaxID=390241 RepID=A0A1H9VEN9_9SPHI|nr:hypothetical protein SAMN04488023_1424 [Pedobacter rhizosphaerae]